MISKILSIISLVVVLCTSIFLFFQQQKMKDEMLTKLSKVVSQINDANEYTYSYDKSQEENIKNVDTNISEMYDSLLNTQKNIKQLDNTCLKKTDQTKNVTTEETKTNVLKLGNKVRLSGIGDAHGNDAWIRVFDKDGKDYAGGFAQKQLYVRDNSYLNGATEINGALTINAATKLPGGTVFNNSKNQIRGDTEVLGNLSNPATLTTNKVKVNHQFGGWTNDAVLSTSAPQGTHGASFGGAGNLWSHFPWGADQSTYIRPGKDGANIFIGDVGAANVNIGTGTTKTTVKGPLHVFGEIRICDKNGQCRTL